MTERIRGRKGVAIRKRRLEAEPLCRDCLERDGRVTAGEVVDHIRPLAQGGTDTDGNCRVLCIYHHQLRTAEQFGHVARPKRRITLSGWPEE